MNFVQSNPLSLRTESEHVGMIVPVAAEDGIQKTNSSTIATRHVQDKKVPVAKKQ